MQARSLATQLLVAALLAIAPAIGGCGDGTDSGDASDVARDSASETPARTPTIEKWPGQRPKPLSPQRLAEVGIVSLVPALTEIVIDIGAADALVGIGRYDDPVPGHEDLPRLGDALSVSLESITALHPHIVLVNGEGLAERLSALPSFIQVETIPTDRLADLDDAYKRIGQLTGLVWRAKQARQFLEIEMLKAEGDAPGPRAKRPRVIVIVQRRPTYVAGSTSFVGELLEKAGARNAAADVEGDWPVLSDESLLALAPDVILDASIGEADNPEGRAKLREAWAEHPEIPAVANNRVHFLGKDEEALFRPGPRAGEAIRILIRLVHGEPEER